MYAWVLTSIMARTNMHVSEHARRPLAVRARGGLSCAWPADAPLKPSQASKMQQDTKHARPTLGVFPRPASFPLPLERRRKNRFCATLGTEFTPRVFLVLYPFEPGPFFRECFDYYADYGLLVLTTGNRVTATRMTPAHHRQCC